jgi:hypothetical protein
MSVTASKNVYQWCFIALFVLSLVAMIAQFACLVGLYYLPAVQTALFVKIVLFFSIAIDTVCVVLSCIAAAYVSSLGTVLCVLFFIIIVIAFIIACILCILSLLSSNSSNGSSHGGDYCFFCWCHNSSSSRSTGSCDNLFQCQEPCLTILAFIVTFIGLTSLTIAIYWQMIAEHEHDNTPFLIALLVCSALRTILASLVIIFFQSFITCGNESNNEEEGKNLLRDDVSMHTLRKLPTWYTNSVNKQQKPSYYS